MGLKVWRFDVEGTPHNVQLEHGYWSGKRRIWVDGQLVQESRKFFDTGSEHRFEVAGKTCLMRLIMAFGSLSPRYELWVDGELVGDDARYTSVANKIFSLIWLFLGIVIVAAYIGLGLYLMGVIDSQLLEGEKYVKLSDFEHIVSVMWVALGMGFVAGILVYHGIRGLLRR